MKTHPVPNYAPHCTEQNTILPLAKHDDDNTA